MTTLKKIPTLILGSVLVVGLACRKPEPMKAPEPPKVDHAAEEAAKAKIAAEVEAKRKAEEEARKKAEQEKLETARKAEAARLSVYRQAAEKALQDIHFDYDKSDIKAADKAVLQILADFLKLNPQAQIQIEGHCDERGTIEYNLALGEHRASATRDFLKALGVAETRMATISYGKERPLCTEPKESCWHKNRRAHFVLKS